MDAEHRIAINLKRYVALGPLMRITLSLLIALPLASAHAASFDCKKAATANEKAICADETLSRLDSLLAQTYRMVLAKHSSDKDSAKRLVRYQKDWLSYRDSSCSAVTCLRAAYEERIDSLRHDFLLDELFPQPHNSSNWAACVAPPDSGQTHCRHERRCAENSNSSYFIAESEVCPGTKSDSDQHAESQTVRLYFYPEKGKPGALLTTIMDVSYDDKHLPTTSFEFDSSLDRNGYAMLEIQSASGGTNVFATSQNVYRFDPKDRLLYLYYSGLFDSLRYFDGHLVGALPGRDGINFEIHDVHPLGSRDVVDARYIAVDVDEDPDDHDPTACTFYDAAGKKIEPPNKKWVDEFCMGAPVTKAERSQSR